jgi:ribonuclease Z
MYLNFIGTGSGRTSLNRFHSSLLFKSDEKSMLLDAGDSISRALLNQKLPFNNITDIIISHYHSDHVAGLPSLLSQMIIENRTEPIEIYTHSELVKSLIALLEISNIFIEKLNFLVEIIPFEFDKEIEISNDFKFTAKQNSHIKKKHEIDNDKLKFISSSFLFKVGNNKIVYTSDIGNSEDLFLFNNIQADICITETTHLSFNDIENAATILNPTKIYLTHIDNETELRNWYNNLSANEKEKFIIAFDGMMVDL